MEAWFESWMQTLQGDLVGTRWALVAILVITAAEQLIPAEKDQTWNGRLRNVAFFLQFKLLGLAGVTAWYTFGPHLRAPRHEIDPVWSVALVVANLVAIDLCYYAYHRAQHRFRFLWALHELHHADSELNATTSYRTYWLEAPVQVAIVGTPTMLLFGDLGAQHGMAILTLSLFFLIFAHSNLRISLGPLTGWIIGPQVHRIHHSRLPEHHGKNLAQFFPFIDRIFGTFYRPAPDEFPPTGVPDGLASDASFGRAMARPLAVWAGK